MRRGLFNGMLIGTAAGLAMAAMFKNKMRPNTATRKIMGQTKKLGRRTGRMVTNVARDVSNFMR